MGADTILMEWRALKDELKKASVQDAYEVYRLLRAHEKYMVNKGYQIGFGQIKSATGEIVWQRLE